MKTSRLRAAPVILALAAAGCAVVGSGCRDDCEEAKAQLEKNADRCNPVVAGDRFIRLPLVCSDEAGTILLCQAAAFSDASCDCIGSGDKNKCAPTDAQAFEAALAACE
jgi:hypothetical protein